MKRKRNQIHLDRLPSGIVIPTTKIITPPTPHEMRMRDLSIPNPPIGFVKDFFKQNPKAEALARAKQKRAWRLVQATRDGGSGFPTSNQLRWFFSEYAHRLWSQGPDAFPSSFNIMEAFFIFDQEYYYFVPREEREHFFSINDYWRWYKTDNLPKTPNLVADFFDEGVIYSYEIIQERDGFKIVNNGDASPIEQIMSGVLFVRHAHELSCLLICGENPPLHGSEEIEEALQKGSLFPGREWAKPCEDYDLADKFLEASPEYSKVLILSRFDIRDGKHDVRYVNVDEGKSFCVFTDDPVVANIAKKHLPGTNLDMSGQLERYSQLFSGLASLIYLPVFFASNYSRVQEINVATKLESESDDKEVKELVRAVGKSQCTFQRQIRYLPIFENSDSTKEMIIEPPNLTFESKGYWKPIAPQEMGEDKNGNHVVGRTWVATKEMSSKKTLLSYLIERRELDISGPDPGEIYIQRSPSNVRDVYKIGLTRRNSETRARELSSVTGVAEPFFVLSNWKVKNCGLIEKTVHERLKNQRINPNREFFYGDLKILTEVINSTISEIDH